MSLPTLAEWLAAGNGKHPSQEPKAVKAAPKVVEDRLAITCEKRTADGKCTLGRSCKGNCTCRSIAEWRDCPDGLWKATIRATSTKSK